LTALKALEARLSTQGAKIETVALLTEASLNDAQQQIVQLANYQPRHGE
jgi:hypothetical protein